MENILIRELKTSDTDEIKKIYASITQKSVTADFEALIEQHALRNQDVCLVAEHNDRVVGFMISYILTFGFGIEKSAWIATLGVNPEFMGQGIGAGLAKEILRYYKDRGILNVYTSVRWDSTDLLSFFKTLGFDRSDFINLRRSLE